MTSPLLDILRPWFFIHTLSRPLWVVILALTEHFLWPIPIDMWFFAISRDDDGERIESNKRGGGDDPHEIFPFAHHLDAQLL